LRADTVESHDGRRFHAPLGLLKGTMFGAAIAALLVLSVGSALASHVSCGDTITQDTTLDSDLIDCPSNGIVIGASNITLDLGGHLIDGPNPAPIELADFPPDGVSDRAGYSNVTIQNGRIQEFQNGVDFGGYRPEAGETPSSSNTVRGLSISGFRGITAWDTSGLTIEQNEIRATQPILLQGTLGSSHATIRRNSTSGGDVLVFAPDSTLERNSVQSGRILVGGDRYLIARNLVRDSSDVGIGIVGDDGVVTGNVATGHVDGLYVAGTNLVEKNDFSSNRLDGIWVVSGRPELLHNSTNRNGDDGIQVDSPGSRVTKNRAYENGDFGIFANAGVTDGGGNKAAGNGNPAQCLNVACK
jgi:hypothetical protein